MEELEKLDFKAIQTKWQDKCKDLGNFEKNDKPSYVLYFAYPGHSGFIHIGQVARGWVKNIRNHVKENQLKAAKILSVHAFKKEVDLSLNKVSKHIEKQKIEEFNQFTRAKKLLEILAKKQKKSFDLLWGELAIPLMEEHGTLSSALRAIALSKKNAIPKKIPAELVKPLLELVDENISLPEKEIVVTMSLTSFEGDGVIKIKEFFKELLKEVKQKSFSYYYKGAGKYALIFRALEYKEAEKQLKEVQEKAVKLMKKYSFEGNIKRNEK